MAVLEKWRRDYNTVRPHSSIGWLTPDAYAARFIGQRSKALRSQGSAPWPLATDQMEEFNRQPWFRPDKS